MLGPKTGTRRRRHQCCCAAASAAPRSVIHRGTRSAMLIRNAYTEIPETNVRLRCSISFIWRSGLTRVLGPKTATSRRRSASRSSDVESRVVIGCTVREKHCTTSSSFPTCKISQGGAELKGNVKCTVLRGGRIGPLRCQRSHVILGEHMGF